MCAKGQEERGKKGRRVNNGGRERERREKGEHYLSDLASWTNSSQGSRVVVSLLTSVAMNTLRLPGEVSVSLTWYRSEVTKSAVFESFNLCSCFSRNSSCATILLVF